MNKRDKRYFLGIDCGTSGTKTVVIDNAGDIVSSSYKGYQLEKPGKSKVEQDASLWWQAVVKTVNTCLKDIDKNNVKGISVSAQGGCVLPVKDGIPIGKAISWLDTRAGETIKKYKKDGDYIYKKTGWKFSPSMTFAKIIWYKENKPDIYRKADMFLSTVDYLNYMLTGNYAIDPSNAAMTQAYNIKDNSWDKDILAMIGLDKKRLPNILNTGKKVGKLTKKASSILNLPEKTNVYSGGHDQYCTATGVGAFTPGDMLIATGTAWVNLAITNRPVYHDNNLSPGRHTKNGLWGLLSSIPAAGASMEWFNENFGKNEKFGLIDEICKERLHSSDVLFYPGQTRDNDKRASFIGLGLESDRYDLFLAIMESVAFEVLYKIESFEKVSGNTSLPIMTGGASKSKLWRKILACVLNRQIKAVENSDVAAIGAAVISAFGFGEYESIEKSAAAIKLKQNSEYPDKLLVKKYKEKLSRYREFKEFCTT